jgi:hypothetical protein
VRHVHLRRRDGGLPLLVRWIRGVANAVLALACILLLVPVAILAVLVGLLLMLID